MTGAPARRAERGIRRGFCPICAMLPHHRQEKVNWSAGAFTGLRTLLAWAITSTVPASCNGVSIVHVVVLSQLTEVALAFPNKKLVPAVVGEAGAGTVVAVPPVLGPAFG